LQRLKKHVLLGSRWLRCGWRLFRLNPWLFAPMGFLCALTVSVLTPIPLAGNLLIALLAPMLLASATVSIDTVGRLKIALPAELRRAAIGQSPRELVKLFRDEERLLPVIATGLLSMAVALVIGILAQLVAGDAWVNRWSNLEAGALLGVSATVLLVIVLYFGLAAALVYALPLAFLRDEPLFPAILRSFKTGMHYAAGLLVILPLLLVAPILLGGLASYVSFWMANLLWLIIGSVVLPLTATSLYCSYRSLFPLERAWDEAPTSPGAQGHYS
jgi:hypothetical protein